jgi:hypothetical protein
MKKIHSLLVILMLSSSLAYNQSIDASGLPGDDFSLEGALELFKESNSPEDFEKKLNTETNYVNNLDLNDDGDIDYLKVLDVGDAEAHVLIIQALVSDNDAQDIAVIEIEKTTEDEAILQIIGDEDIYGEEIIVEPFDVEDQGKGPAYELHSARVIVNVWLWPSVRYLYRPGYVHWISPWRWHHYPRWWSPWRPHPFARYVSLRPHYHLHFHAVSVHRVGRAHYLYAPRRTTSVVVNKRYGRKVANYRRQKGIVQTKKTTVISGPNGGKAVVHKKSTTRVGQNQTGTGRVQKTAVRANVTKANGDKVHAERIKGEASARNSNGAKVKSHNKTTKVSGKDGSRKVTTKKTTKKAARKH